MSAVSSRRPARDPRGVGRGLFVDNGFVADYQRLRPYWRWSLASSTGPRDHRLRVLFFLELTFGLDEDPLPALGGRPCRLRRPRLLVP